MWPLTSIIPTRVSGRIDGTHNPNAGERTAEMHVDFFPSLSLSFVFHGWTAPPLDLSPETAAHLRFNSANHMQWHPPLTLPPLPSPSLTDQGNARQGRLPIWSETRQAGRHTHRATLSLTHSPFTTLIIRTLQFQKDVCSFVFNLIICIIFYYCCYSPHERDDNRRF